ncbi:MAG: AAA family ATPase [Chloroflexi bacterium]|nr:AAA family ATPase [Acidobacteriota bacterium]MDA1174701.1 AAA family ATPase [Chloroflexota bacterium]
MTPLELFVGRQDEIEAFEQLLEPTSSRWAMLVSGLSGTGKSLLIDWLGRYRCESVPHATVQLTPNTTAPDFLRIVAGQLDPAYAEELGQRLDELERTERQSALVNVAPTMQMEGKVASRISRGTQTSNTTVDFGSVAEIEMLQRETRRLDTFIDVLKSLAADPWVLFVDEAEHLEGRECRRFLLERLVPRLHGQFPGFRLYLSGQRLPDEANPGLHEHVRIELGELKPDEVASLLEKAGITDDDVKAKVMQLTSGHPLLLGMIMEDEELDAKTFDPREGRTLPDRLDQGAVTAWIYGRILDRLPEAARPIAAYLALFDWFDLSILRASLDTQLKEAVFRDLIRRSFVKQIAPGQWRCHDIVRLHLAAERRNSDPKSVASVSRRMFQAFVDQMLARAEREGKLFFTGRLEYARGALASASEFSAETALSFVTDEFFKSITDRSDDYLFGLTRTMDAENRPAAVRDFGRDIRRMLEHLNAGQADKSSVAFADGLASEARRLDNGKAGELLGWLALGMARRCGEWETALRLARERVDEQRTVDNGLMLAIIHAEAGSADEAHRMLQSIRGEVGDTVEVLTGLGLLNLTLGETDQARRHLADAIATASEGTELARLLLAQILSEEDEDEAALLQVERLLEVAPQHQKALRLRQNIQISLGRYQSVSLAEGQAGEAIREGQDNLLAQLATDNREGVIMTALAEDSSSVPVPFLLMQGELVALRGDEEGLERIHSAILEHAPEAGDLV